MERVEPKMIPRQLWKLENGGAVVELVLVLPILLMIVMAIIQIVLMINTKSILDHVAYEGARTAAVGVDQNKVSKEAERASNVIPRGAGFLSGMPRVRVHQKGKSVLVKITAKVTLLPFLKQAFQVVGSEGVINLVAEAVGKTEPYLGY